MRESIKAPKAIAIPPTKTARFLMSFQSVDLLPEHRNYGDESEALRDLGMPSTIATALIRWGEQHDLVCRFETSRGGSNNAYSWQPVFLLAAGRKHIERYGVADLPAGFLRLISQADAAQAAQAVRTAQVAR